MSFGKQDDDQPGGRPRSSNPLVEALEHIHEDALNLNLSAAEYGQRVIDALAGASREDIAGAAQYLSEAIGQASPDDARMAAIERLTEMHAAGKITKEQFESERKRLSEY
jgi:hypothetical protein